MCPDTLPDCAVHGVQRTLTLIGAKWTMPIMWSLCSDPKGFNQIEREISGISPRVLSARLKELIKNELVAKTVFPTTPPTVEYALTQKGLSLRPILKQLNQWGESTLNVPVSGALKTLRA
ncbi:helix-turn-helix domain-containing protein [soil metagenome]